MFSEEEQAVANALASHDLYFFTRWMFQQRKGYKWRRAKHHAIICEALMRVYRGETKRLIINIPPRYSKTEIAVVNFIAWAMGRHPDAEFIHASYAAALAINNSTAVRALVQHEAYRQIFPEVELASDAQHHWKTTAGGVMYSTGTDGTATGFGAGKMREGFGGCFPAGTLVWTESGLMPIDRIVRQRLGVHVWSYDYEGRMVLRPVIGWHENPPNAIVRVEFDDGAAVECTPDHRFWTQNRGWVRADSLREDDRLPRVRGCVEGLDHVRVDSDGGIADRVGAFVSGHRHPVLVRYVRHDEATFCLTVKEHHNFSVEHGVIVKNCIIIDDPIKASESRSTTVLSNVIRWFQGTIESRLNTPDTPIIVIMQRLNQDDLAGWLLAGGNGEKWEHVCLEAWQDDGKGGRVPLWPEKHSASDLKRMEMASPYVFAGQYMQNPAPLDGGMFKPHMLEVVDAVPAGVTWVRGWDFGSTVDGDATAGGKLGRLPDGRFIIGDMLHMLVGPDERDRALMNAAKADGRACTIGIPQDPGQAGKTQAAYLTRFLSGFVVRSSTESGDKVTRADPFAAQVNVGNVLMVRGGWNAPLMEEMRLFPNGTKDRVDALSRAFMELQAAPKIVPVGPGGSTTASYWKN